MKTTFNRWLLVGVLAFLSLLAVFWHDVSDSASDAVVGWFSSDMAATVLSASDLTNIRRIRIEPEHNNIHSITVSALTVRPQSASAAQVSFTLDSKTPGNDYPWLRISLYTNGGSLSRRVEMSPTQYEHGTSLADEAINVALDLRPGEGRVTVQAFYPVEKEPTQ